MSNIAINKIISPQSSVGNTTTKNSSANQSDFGGVLNKQIIDANLAKDGSFVLGKNITIIKPDLKPVTAEELQEKFGITKADAEGMLKLPPVLSDEEEQKITESLPTYIAAKQRSDSAQVETVARDNNGQIIAVLWKDGSALSERNGVIGNTPAETRENLLKMPNVTLESYNANEKAPTRLEIQAEQIAFTKKHPELFQQIPDGLLS